MFKFLILIAFLFAGNLLANDTIPNRGFENWESETKPLDWETTNKFTGQIGVNPVIRTEDSHTGDYAIKLETVPTPLGQSVPGAATLGIMTMDSARGGVGISGKPIRMTGYYKHLTSGDEINILLHAFANNDTYSGTVGFGQTIISEKNEDFQQFELTVDYYNEYKPDSINVIIITNIDSSESEIIVDDLELEMATSIETVRNENINIYPNPASDRIKIDDPAANEGEYRIYNINGSLIQQGEYNDNIPVSSLSPGLYGLIIENREIRKYKFIKE